MECKRHSIQYFIKSLMIFMLFEEKKNSNYIRDLLLGNCYMIKNPERIFKTNVFLLITYGCNMYSYKSLVPWIFFKNLIICV